MHRSGQATGAVAIVLGQDHVTFAQIRDGSAPGALYAGTIAQRDQRRTGRLVTGQLPTHMDVERREQLFRAIDAQSAVMVASDDRDGGDASTLDEIDQGAIPQALLGRPWVGRIKNVPGDKHSVDRVGARQSNQLGEGMRLIGCPRPVVEGGTEVPVAGVEDAHGVAACEPHRGLGATSGARSGRSDLRTATRGTTAAGHAAAVLGLAIIDGEFAAGSNRATAVDLNSLAEDAQIAVGLAAVVEVPECVSSTAIKGPRAGQLDQLDDFAGLVVVSSRGQPAQFASHLAELGTVRNCDSGK